MLMPNSLVRFDFLLLWVKYLSITDRCAACESAPHFSSFLELLTSASILELREVTASKARQDVLLSDFGRVIDEYLARMDLDAGEASDIVNDNV